VSEPDTSHSPVSTDDNSFGANQWLVDEMWQAYQKDPSSVDPSWHPYFESHGGPAAPTTPPPATGVPETSAPPAPAPPAPPVVETAPEPTSSSQPSTGPINTPQAKTTSVRPKPQPIPAEAPAKQATPATVPDEPVEAVEDEVQTLRGVAKAIAANMDQSIEVPTATSVRTVPAKLMMTTASSST
jgi:2-oxoglutarate dehydrogenase complex, dehydrogenase (E1) component, and related enzymes